MIPKTRNQTVRNNPIVSGNTRKKSKRGSLSLSSMVISNRHERHQGSAAEAESIQT